ncbi:MULTISPECIES: cytochrome c biogenesis heme-transporting ATPase CcmA [unclassified Halorhodospira]|uniref:cytochrome c biogenesis heme-transporting ATPase CcmA n=1 Tax=unclassified Halorhodospira TaxID=2626748 RepID=UPI001EE8B4B1|nr:MULTISPECIES: cytochrome c biogenesis heme-transporting ATPase CcmA [unclassified Halorhodospira]MCG5538780.1 cytochrome c biogenesis heme-transporting ATPase CcmA [Halorhodospira sp. 9622]MCG5541565.1 cytochrome c biogenesis heme-transporting ATPase CcmA [Halorhodospira sp. M39old]MCG5544628.1 cytochrome c biogenesis heme-transporting ATPase CcmA [Halorhodospira sp. M38]
MDALRSDTPNNQYTRGETDAAASRLRVEHLACRRGEEFLFEEVSFALGPGELLFVRGRNGSGKTTLLRTLCGLTEPARGRIHWLDQEVRRLDDRARRQMLYVGHRDAVKDELTPLENLQVHQGLRGESSSLDERLDALEQAGLAGREDIPVRYLSQGQRRRTALARLLLSPARLWILDEPLTALDRRAVAWLFERIAGHLQHGGLVITTSHQSIDGLPEPRILDLD